MTPGRELSPVLRSCGARIGNLSDRLSAVEASFDMVAHLGDLSVNVCFPYTTHRDSWFCAAVLYLHVRSHACGQDVLGHPLPAHKSRGGGDPSHRNRPKGTAGTEHFQRIWTWHQCDVSSNSNEGLKQTGLMQSHGLHAATCKSTASRVTVFISQQASAATRHKAEAAAERALQQHARFAALEAADTLSSSEEQEFAGFGSGSSCEGLAKYSPNAVFIR